MKITLAVVRELWIALVRKDAKSYALRRIVENSLAELNPYFLSDMVLVFGDTKEAVEEKVQREYPTYLQYEAVGMLAHIFEQR